MHVGSLQRATKEMLDLLEAQSRATLASSVPFKCSAFKYNAECSLAVEK